MIGTRPERGRVGVLRRRYIDDRFSSWLGSLRRLGVFPETVDQQSREDYESRGTANQPAEVAIIPLASAEFASVEAQAERRCHRNEELNYFYPPRHSQQHALEASRFLGFRAARTKPTRYPGLPRR